MTDLLIGLFVIGMWTTAAFALLEMWPKRAVKKLEARFTTLNTLLSALDGRLKAVEDNQWRNRRTLADLDKVGRELAKNIEHHALRVEKLDTWAGAELGIVRSRIADVEGKVAVLERDTETKKEPAAKAVKTPTKPRKVRL